MRQTLYILLSFVITASACQPSTGGGSSNAKGDGNENFNDITPTSAELGAEITKAQTEDDQLQAKVELYLKKYAFVEQRKQSSQKLCENLYSMRLSCPLFAPIIGQRNQLVSCMDSKREPSFVDFSANGPGTALTGTWTLQIDTDRDSAKKSFVADIPAEGENFLFSQLEFAAEFDGARDSDITFMDTSSISLLAPDDLKHPVEGVCLKLKVNGLSLDPSQCDPLLQGEQYVDGRAAYKWDISAWLNGWQAKEVCTPDLPTEILQAQPEDKAPPSSSGPGTFESEQPPAS